MISVIIPTYRDDERLNKCLQALTNQTLERFEFEVIVVNNCPKESLDINFDYLNDLNLKVFSELSPGSYAARNKGIKESKGEILAFTDSDCIPNPDWLKNAKAFFYKNKEVLVGILTGPVKLFYKNSENLSPTEIYEKYTAFPTEAYAKDGFAITANWFSYKSVIQEFGGFNDILKSNGDSELSGKISQKYEIVYLSNLIVNHPARYEIDELIQKYKRRLGGTYQRMCKEKKIKFGLYILNFIYRRYRFAVKKIFTVSPKESWAIIKVCNAVNFGALREFISLIYGGDTKR